MTVELLRYTTDPVKIIEESASICYDSKPSADGRIMDACYDSGHQSVLEHATFTFHIEGVSRALLAQLSRHRLLSLTVRSQRYTKEDNSDWVLPDTIANHKDARELFASLKQIVMTGYSALLKFGIPPEDARMVLPNAMETTLNVTLNLRSLIHIANERLCTTAQREIRDLVREMCRLVSDLEPKFTRYLVPKCEINSQYPFCTERKSCGRQPRISEVYNAKSV